jgi:hypothetical protein
MQDEARAMRRIVAACTVAFMVSFSVMLGVAVHPALGFGAFAVMSAAVGIVVFVSFSRDHEEEPS